MCIKVKSEAKMNGAISQSKIYNALFVSIFSPNCTVESYFRKVPQFEKDIYIYTTIILSRPISNTYMQSKANYLADKNIQGAQQSYQY